MRSLLPKTRERVEAFRTSTLSTGIAASPSEQLHFTTKRQREVLSVLSGDDEIFEESDHVDGAIFSVLMDYRDRGGIRPREEILPGLARGEVGLIVSPMNGGKTTFLRNIAADLIMARSGGPFDGYGPKHPKCVYYVDFEDTLVSAMSDFATIFGPDLQAGADQLYLRVRPQILSSFLDESGEGDTQLTLSHEAHRQEIIDGITRQCEERDYGLLIIDTIASGFEISDENAAAEIANCVMKPLIKMAAEANVAVLAGIHQSTKTGGRGGRATAGSHKARGSTAFEDLARAVYHVNYDAEADEYELRMTKAKGVRFQPRRITLEGRRLSPIEEMEVPETPYVRVRDLLRNSELSPSQISKSLELPVRSVERILEKGVLSGGFVKLRRGIYRAK